MKQILYTILAVLSISLPAGLHGQNKITGMITDTAGEAIIGATVMITKTTTGAATDINGHFEIDRLNGRRYSLTVSALGYEEKEVCDIVPSDAVLSIVLTPSSQAIEEIVIRSERRLNSEAGINQSIKEAKMVVSGVSGRAIAKSQDRDAGEVVRRIPGISVIDNKFIITRGLAQRYNNVWINGSSVPSSEAEQRAFSFDIIPAGQIENIMIVKSPVPELPADFTGGFVRLNTKDTPDSPVPFTLTCAAGFNTVAHFNDFLCNNNDGGLFAQNIAAPFDNTDADKITALTRTAFGNNWTISKRRARPDMKFSASFGESFDLTGGNRLTVVGAANYSNSSTALIGMENSRYGVYNKAEDKPEYLYKYTDDQYSFSEKVGALLNIAFIGNGNRIHFRNMFNSARQEKITMRSGWQNISSLYNQQKTEYNNTSRTTYSGQLSGRHDASENRLEWTAGYSYADRKQPDRRIVNRQENDLWGDAHYGQMCIDQNDIERDFTKLKEHIVSLSADYTRKFGEISLKAGAFADYRTRSYRARAFYYRFNVSNLSDGFAYGDVADILTADNYSADKLYIYDDTDNRDSYNGTGCSAAVYVAADIPIGRWSVYTGLRAENNNTVITNYTRTKEWTSRNTAYRYFDLFPSANISYEIDRRQMLRFAYGMSTNRPEFRELSSSVYYDFDLFSDVKGNPDLKPAYIQNLDLRYELYPSAGETVSLALFYKYFRNPIETTFLDAGGSYTYTFENAASADTYGMELEMRKNLSFIGLQNFDLNFNGALIKSLVRFDGNSGEHNRPMQGQSPYLINAGIYYKTPSNRFSVGLLYNRIGRRIVGIGKTDISVGGSIDNDIPDMYEMPRNAVDLAASLGVGKAWQIKLNIKDLLAEDVVFCQFPKYTDDDGTTIRRTQTTKRFNAGMNLMLSISASF